MFEVSTLVLLAMVSLLVAWFGNQLPSIGEFPGRNWLIVRSLLWLTLILAAHQGFEQDLPESADTILWCVVAGAIVALLYEAYLLVNGLRRLSAGPKRIANQIANQPSQEKADELRQKLLREMRRRVRQRLDYAFGEQALINLPMVPQPDAVAGGRRKGNVFLVPQPVQTLQTFQTAGLRAVPSEETILDTFEDEDIDGQLLILGAPGSGKTTALLKLAEALLAQAQETDKIPYIFELSAWTDTRQDIAAWMMAQLDFDYGIPEQVSRQWIVNGQLLPLLDGLDELAPSVQPRCVEKINEFVNSELGQKVVVCCRSKEYKDGRLILDSLNGALCLQPLSDGQVRQYFEEIQQPEIWEALQDREGLGALMLPPEADKAEIAPAKIPLFLQMIAVTCQGEKGREITTKSELFEAYIARRLSLESRRWDRQRARKKKNDIKRAYKTIDDEPDVERTKQYLSWLARKLNESSIPNVFLIERMQPSWLNTRTEKQRYRLIFGLTIGLIYGLIGTFSGSLIYGLIVGSILGILFNLILNLNDITTVETFTFSFSRFKRGEFRGGLVVGLVVGLIVGLTIGLIYGLIGGLIGGLIFGLIGGLVVGLIGGLIGGLQEDFKTREMPNQGVTASAKNFLVITFLLYPACILIPVLVTRFTTGQIVIQESLIQGIPFALSLGFYFGGGLSTIQHAILRFVLNRQGKIPHNYAQFLKYTTERRLTQQVGGSFRFIHRELLDHFADMSVRTSQKTQ